MMSDPFEAFGEDDESDDSDGSCDKYYLRSGDDDDDDDDDRHHYCNHQKQQKQQQELLDAVVTEEELRDPSQGVMRFHDGTEQALLAFVRNSLDRIEAKKTKKRNNNDDDHQQQQETQQRQRRRQQRIDHIDTVIRLIDTFCLSKHWMMHVGNEKGRIVDDFLKEYMDKAQQQRRPCCNNNNNTNQQQNDTNSSSCHLLLVELGTYCGYSLIRMVRTILQQQNVSLFNDSDSEDEDYYRDDYDDSFHIFTLDVDPKSQAVAKELVRLALGDKLTSRVVTFLLRQQQQPPPPDGGENEEASTLLAQQIQKAIFLHQQEEQHKRQHHFPQKKDATVTSPTTAITTAAIPTVVVPAIGFLFIDHDKDAYLSDILQLERSGLIRKGTHVCADNVLFFEQDIKGYRQHMQRLATAKTGNNAEDDDERVASTRLVPSRLEYVTSETLSREQLLPFSKEDDDDLTKDGLELTVYLKDPPLPSLTIAPNEKN